MKTRIGIVKVGAMGDVLMSTPFLRQLRQGFPKAEIHYHVGHPSAGVLEGNPNLDRVFSFDPLIFYQKKFKSLFAWIQDLSRQNYDYLFILDKKLPYAFASRLITRKRCLGFARSSLHKYLMDDVVPYRKPRHEVHYYLDLLSPLFEPDYRSDSCRLQFGPALPATEDLPFSHELSAMGDFDVWVNSGGVNARETTGIRRLPPELFQRVLDHHLKKTSIVLLGSPDDHAYYQSIPETTQALNLAGKLTLAQSAKVMQKARSVFTTECGAMHLAGCVQQRIIGFFGPTAPERRVPFGTTPTIIWHDQDIYDERYEIYGTPPEKSFYRKYELIFNDFAAALEKL